MKGGSRSPSGIQKQNQKLSAVVGDLLESINIANLVFDQDVIIVSVRGIVAKPKIPENAIQRIGVEKVVNVLRDFGDDAPRLLHAGGSGTSEVALGPLYAS